LGDQRRETEKKKGQKEKQNSERSRELGEAKGIKSAGFPFFPTACRKKWVEMPPRNMEVLLMHRPKK
jgi:hypothetical protein